MLRRGLEIVLALLLLGGFGLVLHGTKPIFAQAQAATPPAPEKRTLEVEVLAIEHPVIYNRFGSLNPYAMMYVLDRDVVPVGATSVAGKTGAWWRIPELEAAGLFCPGRFQLRDHLRPRPLVLRGNVGDVLKVTFTNRLLPKQPNLSNCLTPSGSAYTNLTTAAKRPNDAEGAEARKDEGETAGKGQPGNDYPRTRTASLIINGLRLDESQNPDDYLKCTGVVPLEVDKTVTCTWKLERVGTHLIMSGGATAGGEGEGGSLTQGLFGALHIEATGSQYYRSQVSSADFDLAWPLKPKNGHRARGILDYEARYSKADPKKNIVAGQPVLNMLMAKGPNTYKLIYSDLNAIVSEGPGNAARKSFRELTSLFHDELKTAYADPFVELAELGQLSGIKDGFALNYGASGMGSILLANRKSIGPSANCAECLYEEFFLQSWSNGDPALLERYAQDPSNVYHSYLNDAVEFRNLHAGPKETHVFHLHAQQWLSASDEDKGTYLDSQTIGPLQGFTYSIYRGGLDAIGESDHHKTQGSGNRNRTVGDSIFHCHLYPHFAQGMWGLWRVHDVLEDGSRTLPDGQGYKGLSVKYLSRLTNAERTPRPGTDPETGNARSGTPVPALVPLPGQAMPPLPSYGPDGYPGYPYFIPGQAGHRAPQPPLDFAQEQVNGQTRWKDGGLQRHTVVQSTRKIHGQAINPALINQERGRQLLYKSAALGDFTAELESAQLRLLPNEGTQLEKRAMNFHAGKFGSLKLVMPNGEPAMGVNESGLRSLTPQGQRTQSAVGGGEKTLVNFQVNGTPPQPGAPFADPCGAPPSAARSSGGKALDFGNNGISKGQYYGDPNLTGFRRYDVSAIALDLVVNKDGWHDPQARINVLSSQAKAIEGTTRADQEPFFFRAGSGECIVYYHTNRIPKELELDDFQVRTPTDIIGQHIHLVKFDVTSSDGSGNGFNYEDGTLAADAVLERQCAAQKANMAKFKDFPNDHLCNALRRNTPKDRKAIWAALKKNDRNFQTTVQRWFADPILTLGRKPGQSTASHPGMSHPAGSCKNWISNGACTDRTLRTVFTHDHFAPSSIQHHGFYSALLIEPAGTVWTKPNGSLLGAAPTWTDAPPANPPVESSQSVGSRAVILHPRPNPVDQKALSDPQHRDHREFALAVADFALLYEPVQYAPLTWGTGLNQKGMAALVQEANLRFGIAQNTAAGPEFAGLTPAEVSALRLHAKDWWDSHGRPVAPPKKPEGISKDHHDPYMVNYKLEPIPLRIGQYSSGGLPQKASNSRCGQAFIKEDGFGVKLQKSASLNRQQPISLRIEGEPLPIAGPGDLSEVFSSLTHGDPCTPIFEAFEGEAIEFRLIQGAQEVQHMFTVEGLRWLRTPYSNIFADFGSKIQGQNDNLLNYVNTQEIGISEHFELDIPALSNVGGGSAVTDYLYHFGSQDVLWNGAWGLLRTYNGSGAKGMASPDFKAQLDACRKQGACGAAPIPIKALAPNTTSPTQPDGSVVIDNAAELFPRNNSKQLKDRDGNILANSPLQNSNVCPSGSVAVSHWAVATTVSSLGPSAKAFYDPINQIYDPDALILLPLPDDARFHKGNSAAIRQHLSSLKMPLEPFVLRVRAGECVQLQVWNGLRLDPKRSKLSDQSGDALLPRLVPLNTDTTASTVNLQPSSRLSIQIPVVQTDPHSSGGDSAIGLNSGIPARANSDGELQGVTAQFYAGRIDLESCASNPQKTCATATPVAFGPLPIKFTSDVLGQGTHGLFGSVIVEPANAKILNSQGKAVPHSQWHTLGTHAMVEFEECTDKNCTSQSKKTVRELVVFYQDGLNLWWNHSWSPAGALQKNKPAPIGDCRICDDSYDLGEKGLNYGSAPFWARLRQPFGKDQNSASLQAGQNLGVGSNLNHALFPTNFFSNTQNSHRIGTPTFSAKSKETIWFRVLQPTGRARQRAFVVQGFDYNDMASRLVFGYGNASSPDCSPNPSRPKAGTTALPGISSSIIGSPHSSLVGPGKSFTAQLEGLAQPGTYLLRDGPAQFFSGGVWGILKVEGTLDKTSDYRCK